MNGKQWIWSIILNAFLGYLWLLFFEQVIGVTNSMDNVFLKGLIIILGTSLFGEIVNRITPFHEYKMTHPV